MKPAFTPRSGRIFSTLNLRSCLLVLAAGCCAPALPARAHGDLDLQIRVVSEEIALAPSAALYLKRGGLHHEHEDYPHALEDYDRAEQLDPALDALWFARGRTLLKFGRLAPARAALDTFLARVPYHAEAHLLRARALSGQREHAAAIRDFDRHLELVAEPLPECFLERAQALVALGDQTAALASLDAGLRRLGNLVTLQNAAIALELSLGRPDAALARVDRVLAGLDRKESWLVRRGEILEVAGRADEARHAYGDALSSIDRLPAHHRETKSMRDLQTRLRLKLGS